ncbi:multicopper oxidase family protein [Microlunatus soli]|uniref:Multicopper oxidase with three cupredoxin domains (Includes cell division protein FtsP and spore coat protein CotA) n=1 Tax=Microlunatus soli TaxID=630515 RepID=A0A1H1TRC8_9ACTN|nr:multicopper oxidase family protein [Microlunatus soli]SDS62496.1 Multicopper oxidase with three cupredoxin domains (includes cell division protein FtsP and spore coat protein CotA) [Microlunatus soli]
MRIRAVIGLLAGAVLLGIVGVMWFGSLAPRELSAATMGEMDTGSGRPAGASGHEGHGSSPLGGAAGGHHHGGVVSVDQLVARPGNPDRSFTLRAEQVGPHRYLVNGRTPGPELRVRHGDLVQVTLINVSVVAGVTLHWHGVDVPNAADGVAGVTQDAVPIGGRYVYRFVADRAGTFWYHSHQLSHEQVIGGLFGALVVRPRHPERNVLDRVATTHLYQGRRTINGRTQPMKITVPAGQRLRLRLINTDNGPVPVQVGGTPFRLLATDGSDIVGPTDVIDRSVTLTAGGRIDLELPATPATVGISGVGWVEINGGAELPRGSRPELDLLSYGRHAEVGLATAAVDRHFDYDLGRRPGFVDGRPGLWWTINGKMWPHLPMFMVSEGDVVRMSIVNHSGDVHPMHLHGHRVLVLSRNGIGSTGSPWWADSLNVRDGESYEIAFRADNPGIWMDHCHNLKHAADGLVAHLMYEGVDTPYRIDRHNEPE